MPAIPNEPPWNMAELILTITTRQRIVIRNGLCQESVSTKARTVMIVNMTIIRERDKVSLFMREKR